MNMLTKIERWQSILITYNTNQRKKTKRLTDIHKRHLISKDMTEDSVEQIKDGISSFGDDKYKVIIENEICQRLVASDTMTATYVCTPTLVHVKTILP